MKFILPKSLFTLLLFISVTAITTAQEVNWLSWDEAVAKRLPMPSQRKFL